MCIQATAAIHDLIMLQANTFGLSHISYLNAYSVYIAATIAVSRFEREYRPGEDQAAAVQKNGLGFLLEVLQKTANAMPALERSNAIIRKRMKAVLDRQKAQLIGSVFRMFELPTTIVHVVSDGRVRSPGPEVTDKVL